MLQRTQHIPLTKTTTPRPAQATNMSGYSITPKHTSDDPLNVFVSADRAVLHTPTLDGKDRSNPAQPTGHTNT